jgi:hypothetical protein
VTLTNVPFLAVPYRKDRDPFAAFSYARRNASTSSFFALWHIDGFETALSVNSETVPAFRCGFQAEISCCLKVFMRRHFFHAAQIPFSTFVIPHCKPLFCDFKSIC